MVNAIVPPAIAATEHWGRHHVLPPRANVARKDDDSQICYLILDGVLVQTKTTCTGAHQTVALHVAGHMCGLSALTGETLDHDIVAQSPVSYLSFSASRLAEIAQQSSIIRVALWRELGRETTMAHQWITNLGRRPAYQRVAFLICEIEARLRNVGLVTNDQFVWCATQADFAAAVGPSLVHVNKTFARLAEAGLVSGSRHIRIHDRAKLHELAGFDPAYLMLDRQTLGSILLSLVKNPKALPQLRDMPRWHDVLSSPPAPTLKRSIG